MKIARFLAIVMLTIGGMGQSQAAAPVAADCDRRCLLQVLTDYTEALAFNEPTHLPLAPVVFEAFKVQDGMIRHIEAFFRANGQLHSGWGEGPGS